MRVSTGVVLEGALGVLGLPLGDLAFEGVLLQGMRLAQAVQALLVAGSVGLAARLATAAKAAFDLFLQPIDRRHGVLHVQVELGLFRHLVECLAQGRERGLELFGLGGRLVHAQSGVECGLGLVGLVADVAERFFQRGNVCVDPNASCH